jgi:methionyl-tRNA formyltransferase
MDDNFDTGALLKVNKFPIDAKFETAVSLERKTQHEMLNLFDDFCSLLYSNSPLPYSPQDKSKMRYMNYDEFSELKKIPENPSSEVIDLFARAFWYPPYECAYINLGDSKIEIMPEIAKQEVAQCIHASDYLRMCRNIDE